MATSAGVSSPSRGDAHLWAAALAVSLVANVVLLACFGLAAVVYGTVARDPAPPQIKPTESILVIVPPAVEAVEPEVAPAEPVERRLAQTSGEQRAERPERPRFIGERDTQATSRAAPDADAPPLPAQEGEAPRHEQDFETVESDFQDAPVDRPPATTAVVPPVPALPPMPEQATAGIPEAGEDVDRPATDEKLVEASRERLFDGPNPVDVPVPEMSEVEEPKPLVPERPREGVRDAPEDPVADAEQSTPPSPEPIQDPAFRSDRRKTVIRGSIGRTGVGSLDVADTPMGRYRAAISKAVELEWRRNLVRHRDFIQPGFLTVRFFVQPDGKVDSVQFLSEMEIGQEQMDFTHSSIRDAKIPSMPDAVRRELDGEPLELIFNFYF